MDSEVILIVGWRKVAATYESEPEKGEGRKKLSVHARAAETKRAHSMATCQYYELSSAALQEAIVLASAEIITGVAALVWISGGLGVVAIALGAIGMFAPLVIHLF